MNKVKLPKKVAEAIDHSKYMGSVAIMAHLVRFNEPEAMKTTRELTLIHSYYKENPYLIASALVNGYEVEETPEDKVREYYNNCLNGISGEQGAREADGIVTTLNLLNIKIEGVNT